MRLLMLVPLLVAVAGPALAGNVHVAKSQLALAAKGMYGFSADGKLVYTQTQQPEVITQGGPKVVFPTLVIDAQTGKLVKKLSNVVNGQDKAGLSFEFMMEAGLNAMQFPTRDNKLTVGLFPSYEPSGYVPAVVDPEKGGIKVLGGVLPDGASPKGTALSPNNRWFAALVEPESADKGMVLLYDVQTGKPAGKIEIPYGEDAFTLMVAFAGDRLLVLVDDPDAKTTTIKAFQGPGFKPANQWTPPGEHSLRHPFSVSPDSKKLLVAYHDPDKGRWWRLLDPNTFATLRDIPMSDALATADEMDNRAWSPDGRYFASHDDESGDLMILDTSSGEFVSQFKTPVKSVDLEWGDATLRWFGTDKLVLVGSDGPLQQHPPLIVTITNPVP